MDQELQEERLVGSSGAPGSYALLDDLFAGGRLFLVFWGCSSLRAGAGEGQSKKPSLGASVY